MRRSVRLRKQAPQNERKKGKERDENEEEEEEEEVQKRRPRKPAPRRQSPKPRGGAAQKAINEQARILETLKEANVPAELIQTVLHQTSAFEEAMQLLRESGKEATKQEVRCALIAANVAQRIKDPSNAKKVIHPQSEAEVEIARDVAEALDGYALASMESSERDGVEKLLERYGLSIDKPRGLEYKCHFKPIVVPGVKTLNRGELESFLENNKAHHLAIFSVEREPDGMACFHIEDLFALLKMRSNSPTDADVQQLKEEYWALAKIDAGGVVLKSGECLQAVEWHAAYMQLKDFLKNDIDPQKCASLLKVSSALVPTKRLGKWRRVSNQIRRFVRHMWDLFAMKLITDLISNTACVVVLTYGFLAAPRAYSEVMQTALKTYCQGFMLCQVYGAVAYMYNMFAGKIFNTIIGVFTSMLKKLRLDSWVVYAQNSLEAIRQSRTLNAVAAGTTFVFSSLLKKFIIGGFMSGFGYATGLSTGFTIAVLSPWTLIPIAIGACILAYTTYKGTPDIHVSQSLSDLDPNMGTFGVFLSFLSTGVGCEMYGLVNGKKSAWLCNAQMTNTFKRMLNSAVISSVCDLLLLLLRVMNGQDFLAEYFGETRCERLLSGLLKQDNETRLLLVAFNNAETAAQKAALEMKNAGFNVDAKLVELSVLTSVGSDLNKDQYKNAELQSARDALGKFQNTFVNAQKELESANHALKVAAEQAGITYKPFEMYKTVDVNNISQQLKEVEGKISYLNATYGKPDIDPRFAPLNEERKKLSLLLEIRESNILFEQAKIEAIQVEAARVKAENQENAAKAKEAENKANEAAIEDMRRLNAEALAKQASEAAEKIQEQQEKAKPTVLVHTTSATTTPIANATAAPTEAIDETISQLEMSTNITSTGQPADLQQHTAVNVSTLAPNPQPRLKSPIVDQNIKFDDYKGIPEFRSVGWSTEAGPVFVDRNWKGNEDLMQKIIQQAIDNPEKANEYRSMYANYHIPLVPKWFLWFDDFTCKFWDCD
jgi:histidinol phosphatase-like enzyme